MDIADWRKQIDEIDRRLVELLNERARAARAIGELKRNTNAPIYEPRREEQIFVNVQKANRGPLPDRDLAQLYERIIDVMRKLQRVEADPQGKRTAAAAGATEFEAGTNE
jgi:chorismate mutase